MLHTFLQQPCISHDHVCKMMTSYYITLLCLWSNQPPVNLTTIPRILFVTIEVRLFTYQPRDHILRPCWFVGNLDKKPMILCARSTSRSREQSTKHRSRSENMWRFIYSTVKITWLHDYQTCQIHLMRNSRGAQRFVGFFSGFCFSNADWLGRETAITGRLVKKTGGIISCLKACWEL